MTSKWTLEQLQLIAVIKEYPELYDIEYRRRALKVRHLHEIWEEIAKKVNINVEDCKTWWTSWRKRYNVVKRKQLKGEFVDCKYLDGTFNFLNEYMQQTGNDQIKKSCKSTTRDETLEHDDVIIKKIVEETDEAIKKKITQGQMLGTESESSNKRTDVKAESSELKSEIVNKTIETIELSSDSEDESLNCVLEILPESDTKSSNIKRLEIEGSNITEEVIESSLEQKSLTLRTKTEAVEISSVSGGEISTNESGSSSEHEREMVTSKAVTHTFSDIESGITSITKNLMETSWKPDKKDNKNADTLKLSSKPDSKVSNITKEHKTCSKLEDEPVEKKATDPLEEDYCCVTILSVDDLENLLMKRDKKPDIDSTIMQHLLNLVTHRLDQTLSLNTFQDNCQSSVTPKPIDQTCVIYDKSNMNVSLTARDEAIAVDSSIDAVSQPDLQSSSSSDINEQNTIDVTSKFRKTNNDPQLAAIPSCVNELNVGTENDDFVTVFDLHNNTENTGAFFKNLGHYIKDKFPTEIQKVLRLKICSVIMEAELEE